MFNILCHVVLLNFSNPVLPQSFFEAPKKKPKRHPIHKKKGLAIQSSPLENREEDYQEIPPDVKKVIDEIELEEEDDIPDEDTLEAMEDIWFKAGEMSKLILHNLNSLLVKHVQCSEAENNYFNTFISKRSYDKKKKCFYAYLLLSSCFK